MQIKVRRGGKNSRVHTCWGPPCSPYGWALQHAWSDWAVMLVMAHDLRGILQGLYYYYYFIAISFINHMFLSLIYFHLFTKTTGFSPITVFSFAFHLKFLLPLSPSIFHSHPSHFLVTSLKAPPPSLSLFHNYPFFFPSFYSHIFLLLSSCLTSRTPAFLGSSYRFFFLLVYPLPSPCIASLFPSSTSSFILSASWEVR